MSWVSHTTLPVSRSSVWNVPPLSPAPTRSRPFEVHRFGDAPTSASLPTGWPLLNTSGYTWRRCGERHAAGLRLRPRTARRPRPDEIERQLERTWRPDLGFLGWLRSVDHKSIGLRYIVTAFVFFLLGGIEAAVMRAQLARPENPLLGPDAYNQFFTMHGTTMMFLFAVPVMDAMGIYLVPLMIGARNVAFPRLNAYGYWVYLFGGVLLYLMFFLNTGPDAGWFSYVPLAGPQFSPGKRVDVWAQTITFTEIAALAAAVEIIVTVFKNRAPGMTLHRMPLFVWAMLVQSFMVLFAMPWIATASQFLAMDRLVATHFFNPAEGGDVLLWQHLFWFFGHPEVYIIFLPALGFVSAIVATFTRRPVFGYPAMVLCLIATGVPGLRALGASHVRDRPPRAGRELLHRREHDDRHPERDPDLLLDRDDLGGPAAVHGAAPVRARIHPGVRDRRAHRRHGRLGPASTSRCTTPTSSSRTSTTC